MQNLDHPKSSTAAVVIATISICILDFVLPVTISQTYDRIIPNQSEHSLNVILFAATVLLSADFGLRVARARLLGLRGSSFAHRAGCLAMEKMLRGSARRDRSASANLAMITTVKGLRETRSGQGMVSLLELAMVPVALTLVGIIAGPLVLVPVIMIVTFAIYVVVTSRKLLDLREERENVDNSRFDFLVEALRGLSTAKALAIEPQLTRKYEDFKYRSCEANYAFARRLTQIFDATSTFSTLLIFSIILAGGFLAVAGQITLGAMIASVMLSGRIMPPVQRGLGLLIRRQELAVDQTRTEAMLNEIVADDTRIRHIEPEMEGALSLKSVSVFKTGPGESSNQPENPLLDKVDLDLDFGVSHLIDGAGSSELLSIFRTVAGLRKPDEGEVLLAGQPAHLIEESLRAKHIAYLQPEAVIYRGTVLENLSRFGAVTISDIFFIARQLRLDEDISVLPNGLDTPLRGDGSDSIPPGIKQRISIARALASRPKVILFNHCDKGLDRRSYTALFELFAKLQGRATVLLATDDANMRSLAGRHLQYNQGRLEESPQRSGQRLQVARYRELRI